MLSEADLKDRIIETLDACKYNYYTPQEFYQQYFPYFQRLLPEDYSSNTRTIRQRTRRGYGRMIAPEKRDGRYVLTVGKDATKASLSEMAESQLELINRQLLQLTSQEWHDENLRRVLGIIKEGSRSSPCLLSPDLLEHDKILLFFIRWILTAGWSGPPIARTMTILGRETTLERLANIPTVILALTTEETEEAV